MAFKTPRQLGLKRRQFCALVKTLDALENDRIRHIKNIYDLPYGPETDQPSGFNMNSWNVSCSCGSVCCIGGSAELLGNLDKNELSDLAEEEHTPLYDLFFPHGPWDWNTIKPRQAARALRNYLTYGGPRWCEAMRGRK